MIVTTDPRRWIGFTNDPALSDGWILYAHIGRLTFYVHRWIPKARWY